MNTILFIFAVIYLVAIVATAGCSTVKCRTVCIPDQKCKTVCLEEKEWGDDGK
jgi:hypothetical protein